MYTVTRFKVEDYDKFKQLFLENEATAWRHSYGSRGGRLFRSSSEPKEIILLQEFDDPEKARQLSQSNELRERRQRAGVVGQVESYEEVEHFR